MKDVALSDRSLMGRAWKVSEPDAGAVSRLRSAGESDIRARLLAARGVTPDSLADFLDPKLKAMMPNPSIFLDMDKAARRLADAIRAGEKIGIWSDYDADGATSAAILGRFLRLCHRPDFHLRIPDRIAEGYGPNTPGLLEMKALGYNLVCVLDAGTTAFEPIAGAAGQGMEILVIDHHAAEETLPQALAVVNPNRKDQAPGYGHLCAAGMTFLFTVAVTMVLRNEGWFDGKDGRPASTPELMTLLDLVALGTVCDVVPLTGLNRAFVARGLSVMNKRGNAGINALARVGKIDDDAIITERNCGWVLGPRINAGGRIGQSVSGARLLLEDDAEIAQAMAEELNELNTQRKEIGSETTEQAIAQLEGRVRGVDRGLALAVVEDAHEGVVGISAARLREAYDAPAIVLARAHDGCLKGSARSVPGFDIGHAIIAARVAGILVKGGGHGMAGGLTIEEARLGEFIAFMNAEIARTEYASTGVVTQADLSLPIGDLRVDDIRAMERLSPFGTANETPRLIIRGAILKEIRVLKEKHFKMTLQDGPAQMLVIMWGVVDTPLDPQIRALMGQSVDVYGEAQINAFRGKESAELIVSDIRRSQGAAS